MTTTSSWRLEQVDAARMKILSLLLADPNPVHLDAEAARRLGIADREVNQGPSNMAMVVNMLSGAWPDATLRRLRVRLLGQVLAEDSVEVVGDVVKSTEIERDGIALQCLTVQFTLSVESRGPVAMGEAELGLPQDQSS